MFEQTVETSATPHVTVTECLGNLVVRGTEEQQITVRVECEAEDVVLERTGESFTLTAPDDCFLTCPPATTLTVGTVQENLVVEEVKGPVTVGTTRGNVNLSAVGPAALEQTYGNLHVRQVTGGLQVQVTRGNAWVHQVEGALRLNTVRGNLAAAGLVGGLVAEQVRGNVRLGPPFSPGQTYQLSSNGNLALHLPADASLRLALRTRGGVYPDVPGLTLEKTEGEIRGTLGAGEASLEAQVGGNVYLGPVEAEGELEEEMEFDFAPHLEELGAQIEARVAEAMEELEERLEEELGRIDDEEISRRVERVTARATEQARQKAERMAERIAERARRTAERATERARWEAGREAERARREAERAAERTRLQTERAERRWQRASGQRPRPEREPATDEERLRVLRMVEEGKVSPEQAAELLTALEGR